MASMKELLAGVIAAFLSLFGAHQTPSHQALVATVAAPLAITQQSAASTTPGAAATSSPLLSSPTAAAPPNLTDYVTREELNSILDQRFAPLAALVPALQQLITRFPTTGTPASSNTVFIPSYSTAGAGAFAPITTAAWAASQRIDNLSGTTLNNVTVNGISGLSMSDVGLSYASRSDITTITAWGDSLTYGIAGASFPSELSNLTGLPVDNRGVNALTSEEIKNRMLAAPETHGNPTIIWAGRNDITGVVGADKAIILANVSAMVSVLTTDDYVVMGIPNYNTETLGTSNYDEILEINAELEELYGSHYWDVRSYLVSQYDPAIQQDVTDHANDVPPSSLRSDSLHPNAAGSLKIAQYLESHFNLVPAPSNALLAVQNLKDILQDPYSFSFLDTVSGYKQGGNTILSVFGRSVAVGSPNAAAWMAATSTSFYDVAVGHDALRSAPTNGSPLRNTALGALTLSNVTTGGYNAAVGYQALYSNTSGVLNTALGVEALLSNTTASNNVALGTSALRSNTTGASNIAIGVNSLYANTTGAQNFAAGYQTLQGLRTGSWNVAIGYQAMGNSNSTSSRATVVGYQAGYQTSSSTDNVFFGHRAGYGVTTGSDNIIIGAATSSPSIQNLTTGSQNILIGNNVSLPSATASGQLNIGNILYGTGITGTGSTLSAGNVGIGTTSPWKKLSVSGGVGFDGLTGTTGTGSLCLTANREVVYNAGSDNCLSSLRSTKHDINPIAVDAFAQILALQPVSFIYNNDASSTVRYGFIADDAVTVDVHLGTYDADGKLSGVDDRSILAVVVKAIQTLAAKVTGFADAFATRELTYTRAIGDQLMTKELTTGKLCVDDVCVTRDEFLRIVQQSGQTPVSASLEPTSEEQVPVHQASTPSPADDEEPAADASGDGVETDATSIAPDDDHALPTSASAEDAAPMEVVSAPIAEM
jgi:lysophospholipase L1-like esterase